MHDLTALVHRLEKNLKKLRPWAQKTGTEAFRVYEADIPELKYIVDCYGGYGVVWSVFPKESPHGDEELRRAVAQGLGISPQQVFLKVRQRIKDRTDQYQKNASHVTADSVVITVQEETSRYQVNLTDYLDTGLFLDHRPLRAMLRRLPSDQKVLNLFCYTGSLSVAAAQSGAHVTSVDLSGTYLRWAEKNFALNKLPSERHRVVEASVWDYLDEDSSEDPSQEDPFQEPPTAFDVIIVDPPTFSNSKKTSQSFDVQRDHRRLIEKSMGRLKPKGILWFSTNFTKFSIDPTLSKKYLCDDWTAQSVPLDFRNKTIHRSYRFRSLAP